jgi:hypothetical protein
MFRPVLGTLGDLSDWRKMAHVQSEKNRIAQSRRRVHVQSPRTYSEYKAATAPGVRPFHASPLECRANFVLAHLPGPRPETAMYSESRASERVRISSKAPFRRQHQTSTFWRSGTALNRYSAHRQKLTSRGTSEFQRTVPDLDRHRPTSCTKKV